MSAFAIELLNWLLALQSLLLAAFLWWRRAVWPLAALLSMLTLQLLLNKAWDQGVVGPIDFRLACGFAYGPLMLALVRHLAWRERAPLPWLHAAPVAAAPPLGYLAPLVAGLLLSLSLAAYLVAAFFELARYHRALRQMRSSFEAQSLVWLRDILIGFAVVVGVDFARSLVRPWWPVLDPWLAIATFVLALACVYYLTFRGLQQPAIFAGLSRADEALLAPVGGDSEPTGQDLAGDAAQLTQHMNAHRPFLDPDVNLQALAQQLGWSERRLSTVINQCFERNFNDHINLARVEEAKTLLADPDRRADKLLTIQLDAGFASKSVFHAAFKRFTGLTPGAYRRKTVLDSDQGS